jgi:hypothetical protein
MKLTASEVGHGVTTERYTASSGKIVVILVSTSTWGDGSIHHDHFTVLDISGNRSGIIYSRDTAMKIAKSKVL